MHLIGFKEERRIDSTIPVIMLLLLISYFWQRRKCNARLKESERDFWTGEKRILGFELGVLN